jgi:hypothetical protein
MPKISVMQTPDIEALRAEVIARKGQWAALARVGGYDYSWLLRFAQGKVAEPRMRRLVAVRESLDRLPIEARPQ